MSLSLVGKYNDYISRCAFPVGAEKAEFWSLTLSQLETIANYFYTTSSNQQWVDLYNGLKEMFNADPQKAIISLRVYPLSFSGKVQTVSGHNFSLGGVDILGTAAVDHILVDKVGQLTDIGYFDINYFQSVDSYLSYKPYTTLQLYIPYYGLYDLDVVKCMHHRVRVYTTIDLHAGDVIYYICRSDYGADTNEELLDVINSHVAIDVAMYSSNLRDIFKYLVGKGITNIPKLIQGLQSTATELANVRMGVGVTQKGELSGFDGFHSPQTLHLLRFDPVVRYALNDTNYAHVTGIPCESVGTISSFSGYTVVSEVHSKSIAGATDKEIAEIEDLLKQGVLL